MKQVWKKRAVVATVMVFVCTAVYLNWRYAESVEETSKILGQSTLVNSEQSAEQADDVPAEVNYFATARLSRKQARDNAISMLKEAEILRTSYFSAKPKRAAAFL